MSAGIWKEGNGMILVSSQNSSAGKKMIARKLTKNYQTIFQTLLPSFSFCTRILKAVWNITTLSVDIFRASNTMVSVITEDKPCSFVATGMIAREYIHYLGICNSLCTSFNFLALKACYNNTFKFHAQANVEITNFENWIL